MELKETDKLAFDASSRLRRIHYMELKGSVKISYAIAALKESITWS